MKYQKIMNFLDNATNQPSRFRTKYWVEINDNFRGRYNPNSQIEFKTSILKLRLCDYNDAYTLIKGNIGIAGNAGPAAEGTDAQLVAARLMDKRDKEIAFKNCAPFMNCISEINTNS